MDDAVQQYIDAIPAAHRPLFDRVHDLILEVQPDAQVMMSYGIPTYKAADRLAEERISAIGKLKLPMGRTAPRFLGRMRGH